MDLVEQIGSGVGRIRDLMEEAGLPDPAFMLEGMFTVTLLRPVDFETWINNWKDDLTENRVNILTYIQEDPSVSIVQLSELTDISTTSIEKNLKWLRENGFLSRHGSDKSGKWKINYR